MSGGIPICVCERCGHAVFPARLLCPACGGREWRVEPEPHGVLEHATSARRRVVVRRLLENRIGSVRTGAGPVVIARLLDDVEPGEPVALGVRAGAVVAQRAAG